MQIHTIQVYQAYRVEVCADAKRYIVYTLYRFTVQYLLA